jgi:hypothetical protein
VRSVTFRPLQTNGSADTSTEQFLVERLLQVLDRPEFRRIDRELVVQFRNHDNDGQVGRKRMYLFEKRKPILFRNPDIGEKNVKGSLLELA